MKTSGSSLNLKQITKSYDEGTQRRVVLNDLDLDLRSPSFVAILGSSGCGKTTLLSILGGLDSDYHGSFDIAGFDAATLSSEQWDAYRGRHVGFVFQNPQLVDYLTVAENVKLAKGLSGTASSDASDGEPIAQSLSLVGMDDYAEAIPNELSGGQAQRAAIACAVAKDPSVILADEPTGSLDEANSRQIMQLLADLSQTRLVVVVTHDEELARRYSNRVLRLADGVIEEDRLSSAARTQDRESPLPAAAAARTAADSRDTDKAPSISGVLSAGTSARAARRRNMRKVAWRHALRKRLRTVISLSAIALSALALLVSLAVSSGLQQYLDTLSLSFTLDHPMKAQPRSVGAVAQSSASGKTTSSPSDGIVINNAGTETLSNSVVGEDAVLSSLYSNLTSPQTGILGDAFDIQREYSFELNVYTADGKQVIKAGRASLSDTLKSSGLPDEASQQVSDALGRTSIVRQIVCNEQTGESPYTVLAGRAPEASNEIALITGKNGDVLDLFAYSMGFLDEEELLDSLIDDAETEAEQVSLPYDAILGTQYHVVPTANYYYRDGESWIDGRNDATYMESVLPSSRTLTVVGVLQPDAAYVGDDEVGSIAYTRNLLPLLIDDTWNSGIVSAQHANPSVNVFTGKRFSEEQAAPYSPAVDKNVALDLARRLGLSQRKVALIGSLNDQQLAALTQLCEVDSSFGTLDVSDDQAEQLREMSDEEFSDMIESHAPASLNAGYAQNMEWLGAANANEPARIAIYPKGKRQKERIEACIDSYNQLTAYTNVPVACESDMQQWLNQQSETIEVVQRILAVLVGVAALLGLCFTLSTALVSAFERRGEVARMRAMGATRSDIRLLFIHESAFVGALAGAVGALLAMLLAPTIDAALAQFTQQNGLISISPGMIALAIAVGCAVSVLSHAIPAHKAASSDPAAVLHAVSL